MDKSKNPKKQFMRETVSRPKESKRIFARILLTLTLACVFGLTASLTFVVSRPWWEDKFATETETSEEIVLTVPGTTAAPEETTAAAETTPEEAGTESTADPAELESSLAAMIEEKKADMDDYIAIMDARNNISSNAAKSLVAVMAQHSDTDWFDNTISSSESTSGVVIAKTGREVIILTDSYLLEDSERVTVRFSGNLSAEAYLKEMDEVNGIAVIAVALSDIEESMHSLIIPITLGNSLAVTQGQAIIAIGRPLGYDRSVAHGMISYTNPGVPSVDSMVRLLQTDIPFSEEARGMLINTSGELVGWLTNKFSANSTDEFLTAISLTDLKVTIEKMSNGRALALLGIRGQNVTADISEKQGIPMGVYITKCIADAPAYQAGMQSGDILVAIGNAAVASMKDVQNSLETLEPGELIKVKVKRSGNDEYTEFEFDVTLGAR